MKRILSLAALLWLSTQGTQAQTPSNALYQIPYKKADARVVFHWNDAGKKTPIEWGFDLAWLSEDNVRRGMAFCGQEVVDIMRVSYRPSAALVDGKLDTDMLSFIKKRSDLVKKYCKKDVGININDDHEKVDDWYNDKTSSTRAQRWAQVIDLTAQQYVANGLKLVSISPFNEPDYGWNQGLSTSTRKQDFLNICKELRKNDAYEGVRLCGGNTLNCDQAYSWWSYLKGSLEEGNTHQLAGDFNHYADFFQAVRNAGQHATADELHNTMEAMVGVEYGMQTGIWWGTAERARGQFMKATYQGQPGDRLGYAEHRSNWTSASVYRHANGSVQGFVGSSERQAITTTYEFVSPDRDVYFNGQGPMRHFVMEIPGGTGYQQGQTNAETVFDIQSGEDVQPYINGLYHIVNKYSNNKGSRGKYLGFSKTPGTGWTQLQQNITPASASNAVFTQWRVTPVDSRIGGDFSYYDFCLEGTAGGKTLRMDILNWSLSSGGQVGSYPGDLGNNEQWYLQYAGDGWFYIRSKHSNLALSCSSTSTGTSNTTQAAFKEGDEKQMWRLIDASAEYDREAPTTPTGLEATPLPAGIALCWQAVEDEDLLGYDVLRAEKDTEDWNTIARQLTGTNFVDNTAEDGKSYIYAVRATDTSLNRSEKSNAAEAAVTEEKAIICHLDFEKNLNDATQNANHAIMPGEPTFEEREAYVKSGQTSLNLSSGDRFVQLPSTMASHDNITICCWVRRSSTNTSWERIFDFGNGKDQYMFLTPSNGTKMRLALKNGGAEQTLDCTALTTGMKHVAVTIDGDKGVACIYQNGELKATSESITIKPSDLKAACNYIGRSQYESDPMLKGCIDDFRIYNYALSADEIAAVMNGEESMTDKLSNIEDTASQTAAYDLNGRRASSDTRGGIIVKKGHKVLKR